MVFSGSAHFGENSLTGNDENMLPIRDETRVADIYLTEYDRILRHFYFRNIAAKFAGDGHETAAEFLDESDRWLKPFFAAEGMKAKRQKMFFL